MSSAIPVTDGRSPKVSSIFFWKTSWAQIRPRGSLRKRYLPCGELKVVHSELSWSSFIFHNPLRASKIEKYFAPLNLGRISSNAGFQRVERGLETDLVSEPVALTKVLIVRVIPLLTPCCSPLIYEKG